MRMRCVILADYLTATDPDDVAASLAELIGRATTHGNSEYMAVLECLTMTLGDSELVPYAARAALYEAAQASGRPEIGRLFFDASPALLAREQRDDQMAPERPVMPRGRPLTLGERKAMARSHRRQLILHLLRDPHPDVVGVLIGNPHLTETDVVTLAARRPAVPAALSAIAQHERWGCRYPIKRVLAFNPYTPVHLAVRLLTTLRAPDLRLIAADQGLAPPLREQAQALLRHR